MNKILAVLIILITSTIAFAQGQATPTSKLSWDMSAPSLIDVNEYVYKYYTDGSETGIVFPTAVTCTGTASPFTCTTNYPAFTPGNHTITLTASNIAGESGKSNPFAFTFVVTPGIPFNIRPGG